MFSSADPKTVQGSSLTALQLLDQGAANVEKQKISDPLVKDQLLHTLARFYDGMGAYSRAADLYRQSLQLREQIYGPRSRQVEESLSELAKADIAGEHYAELPQILPRLQALTESLSGRQSPGYADVLSLASAYNVLQGRPSEAIGLIRQAIEINSHTLGSNSRQGAMNEYYLGYIESTFGDRPAAEAAYRSALDVLKKAGWRDSTDAIYVLNIEMVYGYLLTDEGRYASAQPLLEESVQMSRKIFGPRHTTVTGAEKTLGVLRMSEGRYREAEALIQDAMAIDSAIVGPDSRHFGGDVEALGLTYLAEGKYRQALDSFETARACFRARTGEKSEGFEIDRESRFLAEAELGLKQYASAVATMSRVLDMEKRLNDNESRSTNDDFLLLGEAQAGLGHRTANGALTAQGEQNMRRALLMYRADASTSRPGLAKTLDALGAQLKKEGKASEGAAMLREAAQLRASFRRQ
jgi:tetratricopeptide (TPR) repeat protein